VRDGEFLPAEDLERILSSAGLDAARPTITSCGSGVTAAALALALEEAGRPAAKVYDGSWAEWGARDALPVETGPSKS
ncbi:MAG: sulfurtransferase, partial [Hyphomicrobiales bacterium]|nr:sulfurtransferase [Hyphomicrobiales bacterium]